jgi:hypothetical protein
MSIINSQDYYVISKHEQRSTFQVAPISNFVGQTGKFIFSSSCIYKPFKNSNEDDINKLGGYSETIVPAFKDSYPYVEPPHHRYSVRIGWRVTTKTPADRIEILLYVYNEDVNGFDHMAVRIGFVEPDVIYNFDMGRVDNKYVVAVSPREQGASSMKAKIGGLPLYLTERNTFGYKLFPRFGGNLPAPQTMVIGFYGRTVKQRTKIYD